MLQFAFWFNYVDDEQQTKYVYFFSGSFDSRILLRVYTTESRNDSRIMERKSIRVTVKGNKT